MAVALHGSQRTWKGSMDAEGHRTYFVEFIVESDDLLDGPANVMQCPGLPIPGQIWLVDSDIDVWAWFRPDKEVEQFQVEDGERNKFWKVRCTASTKPLPKEQQRCQDNRIEDPLLEEPKVSGSFVKFTEEATDDRNGDPVTNSAHEQIRGPQNEWDRNRPSIRIEQNVVDLQLGVLCQMMDLAPLNDGALWGLPARTIKLSAVTWERLFYGTCYVYYKRVLEFEIKYDTWDRDILDEATKVLNGRWGKGGSEGYGWVLQNIGGQTPNADNPQHFIRWKDRNGENMKGLLNGAGVPYDPEGMTSGTSDDEVGRIHVEKYGESDFLILGIPLVF